MVSTAAEHVALSAGENVALGGEPVRTPWPPAGRGGGGVEPDVARQRVRGSDNRCRDGAGDTAHDSDRPGST